jgi:integrase
MARQIAAQFAALGDWDAAEPIESYPAPPQAPAPPSLGTAETSQSQRNLLPLPRAIELYLADHRAAASADSTLKKYRLVLGELHRFADSAGRTYLEDWNDPLAPGWVRELRNGWQVSQLVRDKKLGVVKAFFEFHLEEGRLSRNPARIRTRQNRALRKGAEDSTSGQKNPFSDGELARMMKACSELGKCELRLWPQKRNGRQVVAITEFRDYNRKITGEDLADFIHVSIHTGLRISDVATFDITRLNDRGEVRLRATKNGQWVCVPIPGWLQERIRTRARLYGPKIFRPTGVGIDAITENWRRPLKRLWERIGPWDQKPTPHRFRHTFVRLLLDRMLIDPRINVALIATLAGDTEAMIRKHYSAWMPDQQKIISDILKSSFAMVPRLGS